MSTNDFKSRIDKSTKSRANNKGSFSKRSKKTKIQETGNIYSVEVVNKTSHDIPNLYFTNKLNSKDFNHGSNLLIHYVLKMDKKNLKSSELLFDNQEVIDFNHSNTGARIVDIFNALSIPMLGKVLKAKVISPGRNKDGVNISGDLFRVVLDIKPDTKEYIIYLLDPHHMLADSNYEELYDSHCQNEICLSAVKSFMT